MRTSWAFPALLFASVLAFALILNACSGPWLRVRHVPEDGFDKTLNYQFQAQVHADSDGQCKKMVVRVKALNKGYSKGEPPSRLQLFDDDCLRPVRFERVHYVSKETGEHVRLSGSEVVHFFSDYVSLEDELIGWLWRANVI